MSKRIWKFYRAGGVDQVQLTSGSDLVNIGSLDQKLWIALACPIDGIEFDKRTLELIDKDGDGRVRARELVAACEWAGAQLKDHDELIKPGQTLSLDAINTDSEEGQTLLRTAKALLSSLSKPDAASLSVEEAMDAVGKFNAQPFNGDGVLPAKSVEDEELHRVAEELIEATPEPADDRSGEVGFNGEQLSAFFDAIDARLAWIDEGAQPRVKPLGDDSLAAFEALLAIRDKVDDYFARVELASYDQRARDILNPEVETYQEIASAKMHRGGGHLTELPLAIVGEASTLPLDGPTVNPAWAAALSALADKVLKPLGKPGPALSAAEWEEVCDKLAPFEAWHTAGAESAVAAIDEARLRELAASDYKDKLQALLEKDTALEDEVKAIESVERLVRYRRDLLALANNFVSFKNFYGRKDLAMFQVGTLYIDRRACDLCIDVSDADKHASLAGLSNAYLLYCNLKNASGETRSIVAAMTDGDIDNLMVGRNGVFYDRDGNDWDATVTRIVENPISVRQAFWQPYKKLLRTIESSIQRRAREAEERSDARMSGAATSADAAVDGDAPEASAEAPKKIDVGVVAAIGVAVGGLVAALGMIIEAFFGLGIWMPLGILGILLLISGPSMAIAWLKLRTRNLGPLLDANGWAVNAMARINVALGKSLTTVAALPEGAERDLVDPFADKKRPYWVYFTLGFVLVMGFFWYIGSLDSYLPPKVQSVEVLGELSPKALREARQAADDVEESTADDPAEAADE